MSEQIRRMRLPTSTLTWGPEHDGIIASYVREMAGIHGVTIENDQPNMFVLTGPIDQTVDSAIDVEDSGQALIVQIDGDDPHFFVKLHSWDESAVDSDGKVGHPTMNSLRGKRVRVTVEVID